jgi:hypothetical protein
MGLERKGGTEDGENMVVRPFISALLRNAKTKGLTTVAVRCREKGQSSMNYPAGSCGVSKTRYEQALRNMTQRDLMGGDERPSPSGCFSIFASIFNLTIQ